MKREYDFRDFAPHLTIAEMISEHLRSTAPIPAFEFSNRDLLAKLKARQSKVSSQEPSS